MRAWPGGRLLDLFRTELPFIQTPMGGADSVDLARAVAMRLSRRGGGSGRASRHVSGDQRGVAAALALGASAVQLGTAYPFCPEAKISPLYRRALGKALPAAEFTRALMQETARRLARGE